MRALFGLAILGMLAGCARPRLPQLSDEGCSLCWEGPRRVKLDLLRPAAGANRIYVQATIGDSPHLLFLVDTGADVNVLHREVAQELGLEIEEKRYSLAGLSGRTTAGRAVAPELVLGDATLREVPFAVGVRGVSSTAGFMPVAGILGMETWKRFTLRIDYPKDRMLLLRPGDGPPLKRGGELRQVGNAIETRITVTTDSDPVVTETVTVQLDTGASALLFAGATGRPFAGVASEGLEPVYGVGASEFLPPSQFLKQTRRIPVQRVELGGRTFDVDLQAQWLGYDTHRGAPSLATRGLIGHQLLADHRVWLDPVDGRLALKRSWGPKRLRDGHKILLAQDLKAFGPRAPERDLQRARYLIALDRTDRAIEHLRRWIDNYPDDAEGRVLLARALRYRADLPAAWEALGDLGPEGLVDEDEIISGVNGLILDGEVEKALRLASEAALVRPEAAQAHLALSDALAATDRLDEANDALIQAARLRQNPSGFLLRRSRLALRMGDHHGAMARVRQLVREYPTDGKAQWFYASLLRDEADIATFRSDLLEATERLHPQLRPLDFLVASYRVIGDEERVQTYLSEGLERDCEAFSSRSGRHNCTAWYLALAQQDLDRALRLVDRALRIEGPRSDYLDTKAVVHVARGEIDQALHASTEAARLLPDDVYMQWQVERIQSLRQPR